MNPTPFTVGAYVLGATNSHRALVQHEGLLQAYAEGAMAEKDEVREAYLSHFVFGPEMRDHYRANRNSVAEFAGPCWARFLVHDIDRPDLNEALADARRLVQMIQQRYPETEGNVPVFFSGGKGFHILVEMVHEPPPAVGFQHVCKTLAEALATRAGVKIDTGIYDLNHIIRLPNTRHPRTGLFKVRIESDALFRLNLAGILEAAKHPAGNGVPILRIHAGEQLAIDWHEAEQQTVRKAAARVAVRRDFDTGDSRAPRYLVDFFRFGVDEGERHQTLFRCAAWLTEQGAPLSLCFALLTEPGRDVGLTPKDVERQIQCGVDHASRQRRAQTDPTADPDLLPPGALDFPFGALAPAETGNSA